jgi:toxin-antitoxin system PIN domain toxin
VRALLDVNLLIALLDQQHIHHVRAHGWWGHEQAKGWASSPLTENGFVRIMSQPAYPQPISSAFAITLLRKQIVGSDHAFWSDDISLLDIARFDHARILGPKQLTDFYLLGLAVRNGGRFATLDGAVPTGAVQGAEPHHLVVLP